MAQQADPEHHHGHHHDHDHQADPEHRERGAGRKQTGPKNQEGAAECCDESEVGNSGASREEPSRDHRVSLSPGLSVGVSVSLSLSLSLSLE